MNSKWRQYLIDKYSDLSDLALMEAMSKNIKLAKSFWREGTGDTWLCEAWDQSWVLESRGYSVREDWAVLNKNGERVY